MRSRIATFILPGLMAAVILPSAQAAGLGILRETRDGILYLDRDTLEKTSNGQRVLSSQDFHRVQKYKGHDFLSAKVWYEVDCGAKKVRQLSLEIFEENMAMGGAVYSESEPEPWADADEVSRSGMVWTGVCGKP